MHVFVDPDKKKIYFVITNFAVISFYMKMFLCSSCCVSLQQHSHFGLATFYIVMLIITIIIAIHKRQRITTILCKHDHILISTQGLKQQCNRYCYIIFL